MNRLRLMGAAVAVLAVSLSSAVCVGLIPNLSIVSAQDGATREGEYQWLLSYKDWTEKIIQELRPELRSTLSPQQQVLERRIEYRAVLSNDLNAFARIDADGAPRIYISAGFTEMIDFFAEAETIGWVYRSQDCAIKYLTSAGDSIVRNTETAGRGGSAKTPIFSPFAYVQSHRGVCPSVTLEQFQGNRRASDLRELVIAESMKLVMAHELAHHLNGDTISHVHSFADQRTREAMADKFAFGLLSHAERGDNPFLAFPVLLLFCEAEGFSAQGEQMHDHPAAVRRLSAMIDAARDPQILSLLEKSGSRGQFEQSISQLQELLKSDLPVASSADTPRGGPKAGSESSTNHPAGAFAGDTTQLPLGGSTEPKLDITKDWLSGTWRYEGPTTKRRVSVGERSCTVETSDFVELTVIGEDAATLTISRVGGNAEEGEANFDYCGNRDKLIEENPSVSLHLHVKMKMTIAGQGKQLQLNVVSNDTNRLPPSIRTLAGLLTRPNDSEIILILTGDLKQTYRLRRAGT